MCCGQNSKKALALQNVGESKCSKTVGTETSSTGISTSFTVNNIYSITIFSSGIPHILIKEEFSGREPTQPLPMQPKQTGQLCKMYGGLSLLVNSAEARRGRDIIWEFFMLATRQLDYQAPTMLIKA